MVTSLRTALTAARARRAERALAGVTFQERSSEVCTPSCRAVARAEHTRLTALSFR